MKAERTVALKALRMNARIGVYDFERMEDHPFLVDAAVTMPCEIVGVPVKLEESIDYETILTLILEEMKTPESLMESVADRIALRIIKQFPQASHFSIHIQKINPPLKAEVGSSSVTLEVNF